jgi:hypothetical protein
VKNALSELGPVPKQQVSSPDSSSGSKGMSPMSTIVVSLGHFTEGLVWEADLDKTIANQM